MIRPLCHRRLFLPLLAYLVLSAVPGCDERTSETEASKPQALAIRGTTFGVVQFNISFLVPPAPAVSPEQLQQRVDEELDGINRRMSTYLDDSEISRFNRADSTDWFEVSPDTAAVVAAALEISEKSNGAFDITVGPLVEAWNFGTEKGETELPSDDMIAELREHVGYQLLSVRHEPPALRKSKPRVQIDLSAIAKGYAVDRVSDLLMECGYRDHLVEIGGEDRARGERPGGGPWRVGIEKPDQKATVWGGETEFQRIVLLQDEAIATSGDYRNFFVGPDGNRYSHTIDPRTGRPIEHRVASVSVVAERCMIADAWATALGVRGPEKWVPIESAGDLEVLIVYREEDGSFTEKASGRFVRNSEELTDRPLQTAP